MLDSHQHLWRIARNGCLWPTADLRVIHRDFELADLTGIAGPLGINGTVLVQSQPCDEDTDYLLDLAGGSDMIRAVVGWADLLAPDAPVRIGKLARAPKFRGLRPMLQSLPDGWLLDRALDPAIRAMVGHGLSFDALVFTRHLADLDLFAERHADLAIVIDHGAKPPIASGDVGPWRDQIAIIAARPNVYCKLSGLLTEAGERGAAALFPCVEHLLASFGPSRLMWGSDWPVLDLAANYPMWLSLARALVAQLAPDASAEVFEGTARRFYRIGSGCSESA